MCLHIVMESFNPFWLTQCETMLRNTGVYVNYRYGSTNRTEYWNCPHGRFLAAAVAARHFLVLLHFICMKISHGSMIYIIDEGFRSARQSLEENFPWYAPPPPHSRPLLSSFSHPSLNSFLLPHALPLKPCFIPHQVPFIPLQPFGLLSFHPSISQTLHLYFHPSIPLPSLILPLPHTMERASERGTCDQ